MKRSGKFSDYLKKYYIRHTLLLVGLMFVLFLGSFYYNLYFTTFDKNRSCNSYIDEFINSQYRNYSNELIQRTNSKLVKDVINHKTDTTELFRELYQFSNRQQFKSVFILFNADGDIVASNLYFPNQLVCKQSNRIKEAVSGAQNSPNQLYTSVSGIQYDNGQKTGFLFFKAIVENGRIIGYLCYDWTIDSVDLAMRKNFVDIIVLTDRFDNAFYFTSENAIDSMGKCRLNWSSQNSVNIDGKSYFGVTTLLSDSNIKVITLTDLWQQNAVFKYGLIFLSAVSVIMVGLLLLMANKAAAHNAKSIHSLLLAVNECRNGNIDYRINTVTFEEFQQLYDQFNQMMVSFQELLKNNGELIERKRLMEIKQLKEQFNPHFVFNVMETLKYEILINPKQASQMVVTFANLMRYSINYGNMMVPVHTDISYIENYLILQKRRYSNRLNYQIKIEQEVMNLMIPKLLLQPIVENSIKYGLENTESILVTICGRKVSQLIEFVVEDNGIGIKGEQLEKIRTLLNNENADPEHIGLYNIQRSIKLLYGNDYGLQITSKYGSGTKVIMKFPIKDGEINVSGTDC